MKWHAPGSRPRQALNPGKSGFLAIQKFFPAMRERKILDIFTVFPPLICFHFNAILFPLCELFNVLTNGPQPPSYILFSVASDPQGSSIRPGGRNQLTLAGSLTGDNRFQEALL